MPYFKNDVTLQATSPGTADTGNSNISGISQAASVITGKVYPASDSTTAMQILKADGTTNILNVNTTNSRVGIGTAAPSDTLEISAASAAVSDTQLSITNSYLNGYGAGIMFNGKRSDDNLIYPQAKITADGQSSWSSAATQSSSLRFFTVAAGTLAEKMRLDSAGKLSINATTTGTNNKLLVNPYSTVDNLATTQINTNVATNKGLVIQGFASQSANLQEWQNSSGTILSQVDSTGKITMPSFAVNGTTTTNVGTFQVGIDMQPVVAPTTISVALINSPGNVDAGARTYYVTFVTPIGETNIKQSGVITTDAANGQVTVTIPVSSDSRVTARKIYRSGTGAPGYSGGGLVTTINDNTTTTYVDNTADSGLTGSNPYFKDNATVKWITSNGTAVMFSGASNSFFGLNAGATSIAGTATAGSNTGFGVNALRAITTGAQNTAIGNGAGAVITSGTDNVFMGIGAGGGSTTASGNVYIGRNTASYNPVGAANTFVGYYAGYGTPTNSNYYNTFIGSSAGYKVTTGTANTSVGVHAGYETTTAGYNTSIGMYAGRYNQTGTNNVIMGYQAAQGVTGNSYTNNTIIGAQSLFKVTTGGSNATLGGAAGYWITTGDYNILLGNRAGMYSTTQSNELFINSIDRTDRAGDIAGSIIYGVQNATAASQTLTLNAAVTILAGLTMTDATDLVVGTTTGTKIGTATTQKIGFYNATPVVQPSSTPADATDLATALTLINDLKAKLVTLGLIA
jgi:hypothetical protein